MAGHVFEWGWGERRDEEGPGPQIDDPVGLRVEDPGWGREVDSTGWVQRKEEMRPHRRWPSRPTPEPASAYLKMGWYLRPQEDLDQGKGSLTSGKALLKGVCAGPTARVQGRWTLTQQLMRNRLGGSAAPDSIIWEEAEAQGNSFPGIGMLKDQEVLLWVVRSGVRWTIGSAAWLTQVSK